LPVDPVLLSARSTLQDAVYADHLCGTTHGSYGLTPNGKVQSKKSYSMSWARRKPPLMNPIAV
jgi:hypothetical protein